MLSAMTMVWQINMPGPVPGASTPLRVPVAYEMNTGGQSCAHAGLAIQSRLWISLCSALLCSVVTGGPPGGEVNLIFSSDARIFLRCTSSFTPASVRSESLVMIATSVFPSMPLGGLKSLSMSAAALPTSFSDHL